MGAKTNRRRSAHAGSRLKLIDGFGKVPPDMPAFQPYWGKAAVRKIGRIEETSASFEARSAPRSHPTKAVLAVSSIAFAQPLEMPVSRLDLGFAQLDFFAQQLTGGLDVAGHEDAEGGLQAFADALVERGQLGGAFW